MTTAPATGCDDTSISTHMLLNGEHTRGVTEAASEHLRYAC
jgi:hypothetical protein